MQNVEEKKYLGQIISRNLKNDKNIKDRINKSFGNVNKTITTLSARLHLGVLHFKQQK